MSEWMLNESRQLCRDLTYTLSLDYRYLSFHFLLQLVDIFHIYTLSMTSVSVHCILKISSNGIQVIHFLIFIQEISDVCNYFSFLFTYEAIIFVIFFSKKK